MPACITAIATATPDHTRSQTIAGEFVADIMQLTGKRRAQVLTHFQQSGIERRYSVLEDYTKARGEFSFFPNTADSEPFPSTAERMTVFQREALILAKKAVKNCFAKLPHRHYNDITHLITISCTGMYTPGLDIELVQQLPLASHTERTAINFMGCYAAFNGLKSAAAICRSQPAAKVLIVAVELCSLHIQKDISMDNIVANTLFGDGAAAVLVEANAATQPALLLENFYCDLVPNTQTEMAWHIGNQGFQMALSAYIPRLIQTGLADLKNLLMTRYQYPIDYYAIHPGGKRILEAVEQALGLSPEDNRYAYDVLKNYGNMSSTTILFVLEALLSERQPADNGKTILGLAFGPGLTIESMLLRVHVNAEKTTEQQHTEQCVLSA